MAQGDIIKLLKNSKIMLTAREIAKKLGINDSTTRRQLKVLREWNEIDYEVKNNTYLHFIK